MNKTFPSHGKLYGTWANMKGRCLNENHMMYFRYGGSGIVVCEEWKEYKNFHNWAISNGYAEGLSINRIDNHNGYYPDNCRWITRSQNSSLSRSRGNNIERDIKKENRATTAYVVSIRSIYLDSLVYRVFETIDDAVEFRDEVRIFTDKSREIDMRTKLERQTTMPPIRMEKRCKYVVIFPNGSVEKFFTLKEAGTRFNVTRERIRQVIALHNGRWASRGVLINIEE